MHTYTVIPKAHTSPSCNRCSSCIGLRRSIKSSSMRKISGAIHRALPFSPLLVLPCDAEELRRIEIPKSVMRGIPDADISIFDWFNKIRMMYTNTKVCILTAFKSACAIFFVCRYLRPEVMPFTCSNMSEVHFILEGGNGN